MTQYIHEDDTPIRNWVSGHVLTKADEINFTEDRFEHYDIEYHFNGKEIKLEIKNRHFNHNKYESCDIEMDKWDFLTGNCGELCVLYDDGFLYYNAKEVLNSMYRTRWRLVPDQNAITGEWKKKLKLFVQLEILDDKFFTYDDERIQSKPPREIKPSKYN